MADFESFLFQNIQTIGLEKEPTIKSKSSKPVHSTKGAQTSKTSAKISDAEKGGSKLSQNLSSSHHAPNEPRGKVERNDYDEILNLQEPVVKVKSVQRDKSNPATNLAKENDQVLQRIKETQAKFNRCSSSDSSYHEHDLATKRAHKYGKARESLKSERNVASPVVPSRSKAKNLLSKISSRNLKEMFSRNESNYESNERLEDDEPCHRRFGLRSRFIKGPKGDNVSEKDLLIESHENLKDSDSRSESLSLEPFLNKFEEEILFKSKEVLSGLNEKTMSRGFVQRCLNEIKSLNAKKGDDRRSQSELKEMTRAKIPWNDLKQNSANLLMDFFLANLNSKFRASIQPDILCESGKKVDTILVKKWLKSLEKANKSATYYGVDQTDKSYEPKQSEKIKALDPKRQPTDFSHFYSKKLHKKPSLNRNASAILNAEDRNKEIDQWRMLAKQIPSQERHYENDQFLRRSERNLFKSKKEDHWYNEITEQASMRTKRKSVDPRRHKELDKCLLKSRSISSSNLSIGGDEMSSKIHELSLTTPLKPSFSTLAKLKSPERKILYNEWFHIIKKMETDPKFDLEALIRTRGRFTEHERISYRDRLMNRHQRLRSSQSEPNFSMTMKSGLNKIRSRGGICTEPPNKAIRNHHHSSRLNRNSSALQPNWSSSRSSPSGPKLTLDQHDINRIKGIIHKKDKNAIAQIKEMSNNSRPMKSNQSTDSHLKGKF